MTTSGNECENYMWRDNRVSSDHRFAAGSTLSPYLFTLIMDELTAHIQEVIPWCMLFEDDIKLVNELKHGMNA